MLASTILPALLPFLLHSATAQIAEPPRSNNFTLDTQSVDGSVRNLNGGLLSITSKDYAPPQPIAILPTPNYGTDLPVVGFLIDGSVDKDARLVLYQNDTSSAQYSVEIEAQDDGPASVMAVAYDEDSPANWGRDTSTDPNLLTYSGAAGSFLGCESLDGAYPGYVLKFGDAGIVGQDNCTAVEVKIYYNSAPA